MTSTSHKTFQLSFHDLNIHVETMGQGQIQVIFFHGFGQKCRDLEKMLSEDLLGRCTFHCFGLFFHESYFPKRRLSTEPFSDSELNDLIEDYCNRNYINEFQLLGYSIGARLCFSLLGNNRSNSIFLLAPDGVTYNLWHFLFTKASFMQNVALWLSSRSSIADTILNLVHRMGFYSDFEMKLIRRNAESREKLEKVFEVWNCYRGIRKKFSMSMAIIRERKMPHHFVCGLNDKVLGGGVIRKIMANTSHIEVTDDGHDLIKMKNAKYLEEFLRSRERYLPLEV